LRSVLQAAQTKMPSLPARHPFYTGWGRGEAKRLTSISRQQLGPPFTLG
jgi:predicted ATPase